jgi:hypothetical protein
MIAELWVLSLEVRYSPVPYFVDGIVDTLERTCRKEISVRMWGPSRNSYWRTRYMRVYPQIPEGITSLAIIRRQEPKYIKEPHSRSKAISLGIRDVIVVKEQAVFQLWRNQLQSPDRTRPCPFTPSSAARHISPGITRSASFVILSYQVLTKH